MSSSTTISRPRAWLESLRLRTLPLALASIVTGSAIAAWQNTFKVEIALLALLTAAMLQILSNLANDYGADGLFSAFADSAWCVLGGL